MTTSQPSGQSAGTSTTIRPSLTTPLIAFMLSLLCSGCGLSTFNHCPSSARVPASSVSSRPLRRWPREREAWSGPAARLRGAFQDHGPVAEARVVDQEAEGLQAEVALADVRVPVQAAA